MFASHLVARFETSVLPLARLVHAVYFRPLRLLGCRTVDLVARRPELWQDVKLLLLEPFLDDDGLGVSGRDVSVLSKRNKTSSMLIMCSISRL